MNQRGHFGREPKFEGMRAGKKGGKPAERFSLAKENHQEAQRIIQGLEWYRKRVGIADRVGRISLVPGAGVNRSEKELRTPPSEA